jgi:hypothetical protein
MSLRLFSGAICVALLNENGSAMPGFSFEKISPPAQRKPVASAASEKPRGAVVRMIERFVERRFRRRLSVGTRVGERRQRDDI